MTRRALHLTGIPEADALLTKDSLALLIGMVLDQQIPLERAFAAPAALAARLGGTFDAESIAQMDPEKLVAMFTEKPALHRFPGSMAGRVQSACQIVADTYEGDATRIWKEATDGKALLKRLEALPGFGKQKARIFAALLGKQLGITPPGWIEACHPYGEPKSHYSIADITDAASLQRVREEKKAAKARAKATAAAGR